MASSGSSKGFTPTFSMWDKPMPCLKNIPYRDITFTDYLTQVKTLVLLDYEAPYIYCYDVVKKESCRLFFRLPFRTKVIRMGFDESTRLDLWNTIVTSRCHFMSKSGWDIIPWTDIPEQAEPFDAKPKPYMTASISAKITQHQTSNTPLFELPNYDNRRFTRGGKRLAYTLPLLRETFVFIPYCTKGEVELLLTHGLRLTTVVTNDLYPKLRTLTFATKHSLPWLIQEINKVQHAMIQSWSLSCYKNITTTGITTRKPDPKDLAAIVKQYYMTIFDSQLRATLIPLEPPSTLNNCEPSVLSPQLTHDDMSQSAMLPTFSINITFPTSTMAQMFLAIYLDQFLDLYPHDMTRYVTPKQEVSLLLERPYFKIPPSFTTADLNHSIVGWDIETYGMSRAPNGYTDPVISVSMTVMTKNAITGNYQFKAQHLWILTNMSCSEFLTNLRDLVLRECAIQNEEYKTQQPDLDIANVQQHIHFYSKELQMLKHFFKTMDNYDCGIEATYWGSMFDINHIKQRFESAKQHPPFTYDKVRRGLDRRDQRITLYTPTRASIDLFYVIRNRRLGVTTTLHPEDEDYINQTKVGDVAEIKYAATSGNSLDAVAEKLLHIHKTSLPDGETIVDVCRQMRKFLWDTTKDVCDTPPILTVENWTYIVTFFKYSLRDADLCGLLTAKLQEPLQTYEVAQLYGCGLNVLNNSGPTQSTAAVRIMHQARSGIPLFSSFQNEILIQTPHDVVEKIRRDRQYYSGQIYQRLKEKSFHGGASYSKPGIHLNCLYFDVNSLYPNVGIAYKVDPSLVVTRQSQLKRFTPQDYQQHHFPHLDNSTIVCTTTLIKDPLYLKKAFLFSFFSTCLQERAKCKIAAAKCTNVIEKQVLLAKETAEKLVANSTFGTLGSGNHLLRCPEAANIITCRGQFVIGTCIYSVLDLARHVVQLLANPTTSALPAYCATDSGVISNIDPKKVNIIMKYLNLALEKYFGTDIRQDPVTNVPYNHGTIKMGLEGFYEKMLIVKGKNFVKYQRDAANNLTYSCTGMGVNKSDITQIQKDFEGKIIQFFGENDLQQGGDIFTSLLKQYELFLQTFTTTPVKNLMQSVKVKKSCLTSGTESKCPHIIAARQRHADGKPFKETIEWVYVDFKVPPHQTPKDRQRHKLVIWVDITNFKDLTCTYKDMPGLCLDIYAKSLEKTLERFLPVSQRFRIRQQSISLFKKYFPNIKIQNNAFGALRQGKRTATDANLDNDNEDISNEDGDNNNDDDDDEDKLGSYNRGLEAGSNIVRSTLKRYNPMKDHIHQYKLIFTAFFDAILKECLDIQ
jgi:DNA polymerase elongation subunit (family B)